MNFIISNDKTELKDNSHFFLLNYVINFWELNIITIINLILRRQIKKKNIL